MPAAKTCPHGLKPKKLCKPCALEWQRLDRKKKAERYILKDRRRYESRKVWRALYESSRRQYIAKRTKMSRDWLHFCLLPGDRERIIEYQKGLDPLTGEKLLPTAAVDHDHKTGLIRGVLNWHSNQYLAYFEKYSSQDYGVISSYIKQPPAVAALGGPRYGVLGRVTKKAKNRSYGPNGTKHPFESMEFLLKREGISVKDS